MALQLTLSSVDTIQDKYLKACFCAIDSINEIEVRDYEGKGRQFAKLYERNFIINFAYNLGKMTNDNSCAISGIINGEVGKKIFGYDNLCTLYQKSHHGKKLSPNHVKINVYPDFLIHEKQEKEFNPKEQHLIMEAKTSGRLTKNAFNWDFFKLNVYLDCLKYSTAVYLIINEDVEKIKKYIKEYEANQYFLDTKRGHGYIYFIFKTINNSGVKTEMYKLEKEYAE